MNATASGQQLAYRVMRSIASVMLAAILASGCATLPEDYPRIESHAWGHPEQTPIGRAFCARLEAHPGLSALRLLPSGIDAFAARIALAESAQRTLDLQYYIVRDDDSTNALLERVAAAAERGVRVRMLVDDYDAVGRDFDVAALSAHPNVEVRLFNPFLRRGPFGVGRLLELLGDAQRLNHRMHNKMFVADNAAAVIGGRNLGNEYFGAEAESGFVDLDVLALGPVVQQASASFDAYWASPWAIPIEAFAGRGRSASDARAVFEALHAARERLRESTYGERVRTSKFVGEIRAGGVDLVWARAEAVFDVPEKGKAGAPSESRIWARVRPVFESARSEAFFVSPYFVPGEAGVASLRALRERGVTVRVLTNSLAGTDTPIIYAGYRKYQRPLLEAGIELYELRPVGGSHADQEKLEDALGSTRATLHAKTFAVDGRYVFIGSMNLDPRSARINTEFGMLIDSRELAGQVLAHARRLIDARASYRLALAGERVEWITEVDGREARMTEAPDAGLWRRVQAGVLSALAPEELL